MEVLRIVFNYYDYRFLNIDTIKKCVVLGDVLSLVLLKNRVMIKFVFIVT